ncbi:hypothetical protein BT69DRAFT_503041 [Atractiella rhizophila]|nr:hypothetical protein BT69DRAFT_503041 [Atractiella rhizophila]
MSSRIRLLVGRHIPQSTCVGHCKTLLIHSIPRRSLFTSPPRFLRARYHRELSKSSRTSERTYGGSGEDGTNWRPIPEMNKTGKTVLWGIIGANTIFLSWQSAEASYQQGDPQQLLFMAKNFILSPRNLSEGRIHTFLTCCFSQKESMHFLLNMFGFWSFSSFLLRLLSPAAFLSVYLASGLVGSASSLAWQHYNNPRRSAPTAGAHGASGAIMGIMAWSSVFAPRLPIYIYFIPVPAGLATIGLAAYEIYDGYNRPNRRTDTGGHLGGLAAGAVACVFMKRMGVGLRI